MARERKRPASDDALGEQRRGSQRRKQYTAKEKLGAIEALDEIYQDRDGHAWLRARPGVTAHFLARPAPVQAHFLGRARGFRRRTS